MSYLENITVDIHDGSPVRDRSFCFFFHDDDGTLLKFYYGNWSFNFLSGFNRYYKQHVYTFEITNDNRFFRL